ncbi:MAG: Hsp20/alpha crystallin family protein [Planctomycetales bacterium]|nr:Hsp20/alpha crystallin family protein [Planctomycetales bacterium]
MTRGLRTFRNGSLVPFEDFYREVDNLVGGLLRTSECERAEFSPRVNVVETEAGFEVTADLPGINADDVSVELHDGQLLITGKRVKESEEEGRTYHRVERAVGEFRRVIAINVPIDEDKIKADYEDGVLKVTLPKSAEVRPKRIEVRTAAAAKN